MNSPTFAAARLDRTVSMSSRRESVLPSEASFAVRLGTSPRALPPHAQKLTQNGFLFASAIALTFALPSVTPEKRQLPPPSPSFLNRLSRRISQSGANLKRKVSQGRKAPVRRASEADKENRISHVRSEAKGKAETTSHEIGTRASEQLERLTAEPKPSKGTLKRGLRVSVVRRSKSEGGRDRTPRAQTGQDRVREIAIAAGFEPRPGVDEVASQVSSHRGSYFYSNSLGVCWDGHERVHPDAFEFKPYSSNADVLPSPVIASNRVVYASTLSSFPPRPPLRPRTPPQMTPASQIIAEYRALHPKTPSVYSFSDFDTDPVVEELAPVDAAAPPPPPLNTTRLSHTSAYASSFSSSVASSRPSVHFCAPTHSEDSSTSLESLARSRDVHDITLHGGEASIRAEHDSTPLIVPKAIPRFALVDSGPIALRPKASLVFSECPSTIDSWRDCESHP
ncbi:uncharacterized protein JCM15063_004340 [Sporobolomyces koalae]|uniref:uncharacterized protein n=1 Tax=Sporobolomyces koalae TaxID=500713 RepID=UPI00317CDAD1